MLNIPSDSHVISESWSPQKDLFLFLIYKNTCQKYILLWFYQGSSTSQLSKELTNFGSVNLCIFLSVRERFFWEIIKYNKSKNINYLTLVDFLIEFFNASSLESTKNWTCKSTMWIQLTFVGLSLWLTYVLTIIVTYSFIPENILIRKMKWNFFLTSFFVTENLVRYVYT